MGILSKLKTLLGIDTQEGDRDYDAAVTVEREPQGSPDPDAGSERAVKGTGGSTADRAGDAEDVIEEAESEEAEPEEAESVEVIKGIGPAYAERLAEAGVETVAELAAADAASLAEETDIAEGRLETWIERAQHR